MNELEQKINEYATHKDKVTRIIGFFLKAKNIKPENKEQLYRIYSRHVKDARELDCYSDEKIKRTMKYLIDNANYKWTLGSVLKHIDEDFNLLEGREPIITLKNGEAIFNLERLKQLEREGVIYYTNAGWKEVV